MTCGIQVAAVEVVEIGAESGVLEFPCTILPAGLGKAFEAHGFSVGIVEILPVVGSMSILFVVTVAPCRLGHLGNAKIVVGVLDCARDRTSVQSFVVGIIVGTIRDVANSLPVIEVAPSFDVPIRRLFFRVFDDGCVRVVPVDALEFLRMFVSKWSATIEHRMKAAENFTLT
jgi:hypothetical protein